MSETAKLEARMTLDSVQYQRAAAQAEKQAEMLRRNMEGVENQAQKLGKELSGSSRAAASSIGLAAQASEEEVAALLAAAEAAGYLFNKHGQLQKSTGKFASNAEKAASGLRALTKEELEMIAASEKLSAQFDEISTSAKKASDRVAALKKSGIGIGFDGVLPDWQHSAKSAVSAIGSAIGSGLKTAFIGGTAAAAGFFAYVVKEAGDAREIMQNAVRLNMDTTSLQAWDYAVTKFGISADKAGDILKDVNDKIGDFIVTGGGEAKDVFDALSLSAEEFIGLAPDQALLKMGKAMEGLSTQDKTFLLESLADDASLLIPLLDENGKKLKELRQQAVGRGMIISPQELQSLADFKESIGEIGNRLTAFGQHFAAYMSKPLKVLLDEADKLIERFGGMDKVALSFSETAVNGMVDIVKWAADVYEWFLKWELKLIDLKAFLFGMADGLANVGEMYLKYTPTGMIQDKAAKAITGTSLTDGLAETRKNFDGILRDLADERVKAEQNIAKAHASAEKFANTVGKKMLDAIEQAKKDAEHNIANNYRAPRQAEDFSRSLKEYKKRQAEEAAKEAAKEQDKAAKEQQKAAEALQKAADKAERAWQQSIRGRAEKTARESDPAAPKVPQVQIFSGAPRAAEAAEDKAKKAAEDYAKAVKKAAEAQEKLNRTQATTTKKSGVDLSEWHQQNALSVGNLSIFGDNSAGKSLADAADKLSQVSAESIRTQREAAAVAARENLRGEQTSAQMQQAATAMFEQAQDSKAAGKDLTASVSQAAAVMMQQAAQKTAALTETEKVMKQAAETVNAMIVRDKQAKNLPQAALPQAGIPQQAAVPTPPPVREIKLSGGITVTLNGSDESMGREVVNSKSFKQGFENMFKSALTSALRETARAVT